MTHPPAWNKSCLPNLSPTGLKELMTVAAGHGQADLVITGVNALNVHTRRLEEGVDLALINGRIAAVGSGAADLGGPETEVIAGNGLLALPGFVDAHTHLDAIFTVREFARLALVSGNTTVVSEMAMIAGAAGVEGVYGFMAEASNLPLRVYFLAPPLVPPFPGLETSAGLDLKTFKSLLERPDVLGVGESYWRPVLDLDQRIMDRLAAARHLGKTLEGHAAGAKGARLAAYRAGGVTSCHEAISSKEALERLALGMAVQIREGYIRCELPAMDELARNKEIDTRRLILCTDLASPDMLLETGVMNELVRRAVRTGFDPIQALQMVTLNPADYFGLTDLGRLDPGARADIVLVNNLDDLAARLVVANGRVVARDGLLTVDLPGFKYPAALSRTLDLPRITARDLVLRAPSGPVKVRAVSVVGETITQEEIIETRSVRQNIASNPELDLNKIAVFNRHSPDRPGVVGLAKGLGLKTGAVATSLLWDTNNVLTAGASEGEMALAANRLLENRGGLVVVRGRKILAEMPLPVGGIISEKPYSRIMTESAAVETAVRSLGSTLTRPFLTFQTFCFTGLPFLRLTDKGLVDVRKGELVRVVLE